jgi:hypothetical protein
MLLLSVRGRAGKRVYRLRNECKVLFELKSLAIRCFAANARAVGEKTGDAWEGEAGFWLVCATSLLKGRAGRAGHASPDRASCVWAAGKDARSTRSSQGRANQFREAYRPSSPKRELRRDLPCLSGNARVLARSLGWFILGPSHAPSPGGCLRVCSLPCLFCFA